MSLSLFLMAEVPCDSLLRVKDQRSERLETVVRVTTIVFCAIVSPVALQAMKEQLCGKVGYQ